MRDAFSRRARAVIWGCVALTTLAMLVAGIVSIRRNAAWSARERARLCAISLKPGPSGSLNASFDRLHKRYADILAVVSLSSHGRVQEVHSAVPLDHDGLQALVRDNAIPLRILLRFAGRRVPVWAVTLPLNGEVTGHAWRALFLLRNRQVALPPEIWAACVLIVLAAAIGTRLLCRWFAAHVVQTLGRLAASTVGRRPESQTPERFSESQAVAERIRKETQKAASSDAEIREKAYLMKKQLAEKQSRLDHQLRRAEDKATVDPLTKLRNRRFLEQELEPLLARQRSKGEDLAVVVIDLDNFKSLNDTQGHKVGDEMLRIVGELLRAAIRPDDHAIRLGGDEFLLLFPGANESQAASIVDRIGRLFGQLTSKGHKFAGVSMSAGVATGGAFPKSDGHAIIERADKALYHAKYNGKGQVCAASQLPHSQTHRRLNRTRTLGTVSP